MNLAGMYRIRQKFDDTRIEDILEPEEIEWDKLSWSAIRPDTGWRSRAAVAGLPILLKSWAQGYFFKITWGRSVFHSGHRQPWWGNGRGVDY